MGGGNTKQKPPVATGLSLHADEKRMLVRCLSRLPFPPGTLNAGIVAEAAAIAERLEYSEPVNVITKGDRAKGIFILVKGQAKVMLTSDDAVADLSPGSFFGEISSLFYVPVTATVRSTTPAQFLLLKAEKIQKVVGQVVSTDLMEYHVRKRYFDTSGKLDQSVLLHKIAVSSITSIPLFSRWSSESLESLLKQSREDLQIPHMVMVIPEKSMLVMEEDKAEEVVVITRGEVEITREKEVLATIDSERWPQPVWIGEEGLFNSVNNLCSVRAHTTCQAFRLRKSTILSMTNRYKAETGRDFTKQSEVWRSRANHHGQLSASMQAQVYLPVLIDTLARLEMFSSVGLPFLYDIAMLCRAKVYADNAVIVDGSAKPAKVRKALQAKAALKQKNAGKEPDFRLIKAEQAGTITSESDLFLLPLRGELVVGGVESVVFREKDIIYIPHVQLKEIKLVAKGETLVLAIEGSRLLGLCSKHSAVTLRIPKPVI